LLSQYSPFTNFIATYLLYSLFTNFIATYQLYYGRTTSSSIPEVFLLHRDALRQVPRLVDVGSLQNRYVVGQ
jgi:hypothetical protein